MVTSPTAHVADGVVRQAPLPWRQREWVGAAAGIASNNTQRRYRCVVEAPPTIAPQTVADHRWARRTKVCPLLKSPRAATLRLSAWPVTMASRGRGTRCGIAGPQGTLQRSCPELPPL